MVTGSYKTTRVQCCSHQCRWTAELTHVASMEVGNNGALTALEGLKNLTTVEGGLNIVENASLGRIDLPSLSSAAGLGIGYNDALTEMNLPHLTTLDKGLFLEANARLESLEGLIVKKTTQVHIFGHPSLTSRDGLEWVWSSTLRSRPSLRLSPTLRRPLEQPAWSCQRPHQVHGVSAALQQVLALG